MEQSLLKQLKKDVSALAKPLAFTWCSSIPSFSNAPLPTDARMLTSSFALLLMFPLSAATSQSIRDTVEAASAWTWHFLKNSESEGKFLDGYIVVALETEPDENVRLAVQEAEANSQICRKHFIWPVNGSWIERLYYVTTLGLPSVTEASTETAIPILPDLATRALLLYSERKSYEAVAEQLRAEVEAAAIKEISDAN
jgi:hypothetical protein